MDDVHRFFSNSMLRLSDVAFFNPYCCPEAEVIISAKKKPWALASDGGMKPTWALRHEFMNEMLSVDPAKMKYVDPRIAAYSYVLLEGPHASFQVEFQNKSIRSQSGTEGSRRPLGSCFRVIYTWQARYRDQPDQPRMGALFRSISGGDWDYKSDSDNECD